MATRAGHPLAPLSDALNAWQVWAADPHLYHRRPGLGEVLGTGSANTVFALDRMPDRVLRVRHNSASLSLNPPEKEIELWRAAAKLGLAPHVLWVGANRNVVVTKRLTFGEIDEQAHSQLLKDIHESGITAPRLSLEQTAHRYAVTIMAKRLSHLAVDIRTPIIHDDLQRLDNEPACFCHNDLTPSNIGRRERSHLAIDWEYASLGNRHFDIAVASQYMEPTARYEFAEAVAGVFFDPHQWDAACRVALLMDHLWSLAALDHADGVLAKTVVEKNWTSYE